MKKPAKKSLRNKGVEIGATHYAILPDNTVNYYRIYDCVRLWFPHSKVWDSPGTVPYSLNLVGEYPMVPPL